MRTSVAYEIVDFTGPRIDRIGFIIPVPDGLELKTQSDFTEILTWNDDDPEAFIDSDDQISILTPKGRIELIVLGLANWENLEPFWQGETPKFKTDEEVNRYFYERLTQG